MHRAAGAHAAQQRVAPVARAAHLVLEREPEHARPRVAQVLDAELARALRPEIRLLLEERNAFMLAKSRPAQPGQGGSGAAEDAVGGEDAVSLSLASDFEMIVLEKMLEV